MFEVAEAYEMGRWSRQLAPLFVEFVGVRHGENVLDVDVDLARFRRLRLKRCAGESREVETSEPGDNLKDVREG